MTVKPLRSEPVWILEGALAQQPVSEEAAAQALRTLLAYVGEDPDREGLRDTPDRVLRAYGEQFAGYKQDPAEILATTFAEVEGYEEMVLLKDIPFHSTCEHHLQPFEGKAHVAYLPGDRVVGLSKLARLVDCFARRAQIQERLTRQVVAALMEHLAPRGAAVMVEAAHGCMRCRGVRKDGAQMVTSAYEGDLAAPEARREFLQLVKG
ncbi:MAG: GTP cyclohydrolase I FolE [Candidatus Sericytochromatia bacterium]|nr:GTP cyclohydrolase I FolE [Candidatus Sericytochromatia bacterium]